MVKGLGSCWFWFGLPVLWVAGCQTHYYHSVFLSSKQDPSTSSRKIFTRVRGSVIHLLQNGGQPGCLASPAHAAQRSPLPPGAALGGPGCWTWLLLSHRMKDGVMETGWEQVPLPFALLFLRRRHLSALLFLSCICWRRNKDLMI